MARKNRHCSKLALLQCVLTNRDAVSVSVKSNTDMVLLISNVYGCHDKDTETRTQLLKA